MNYFNECPDCGCSVGELHDDCCDVDRCPDCGMQMLSCDCEELKYPRMLWDGVWPGSAEAAELGWFCKMTKLGWTACDKSDPEARPDLNRLYMNTEWNPILRKRVVNQ